MSGLRLPAQEMATLAHHVSLGDNISAGSATPQVVGILQSPSGPLVLTLEPSAVQDEAKQDPRSVSLDRMLSLTAVPLGESHTQGGCTAPQSLRSSTESLSWNSFHEDNVSSRPHGHAPMAWTDTGTTITRMVNFHAIPEPSAISMDHSHISNDLQSAASEIASLSDSGDAVYFPPRRVQVLSEIVRQPDAHASTPVEHIGLSAADHGLASTLTSTAQGQDINTTSQAETDDRRLGSMQRLQNAAQQRHSRRLTTLQNTMGPGQRGSVGLVCQLSAQKSIDGSGSAVWPASGLVAQPIVDQAQDWLNDDPEALSAALKNNPIFSIIAQEQHNNVETGMAAPEPQKLPPTEFLLSEFISGSTCFGPSYKDKEDEDPVADNVFGMGLTNPIRCASIKIVLHWLFDYSMTLAILVSCAAMTLERPSLAKDSNLFIALARLNLVLNVLFGLELLLKVLTFGLQAYWSRTSNKIDAIIVVLSFLLMAVEDSGLSVFRCDWIVAVSTFQWKPEANDRYEGLQVSPDFSFVGRDVNKS